jgi:hypothetical protein
MGRVLGLTFTKAAKPLPPVRVTWSQALRVGLIRMANNLLIDHHLR